jgi:hypothetical protein
MPNFSIINVNKEQKDLAFVRVDGYTLQEGPIVAYALKDIPFRVVIKRKGIRIEGSTPLLGKSGTVALMNLLARAIRHHEHIKGLPPGSRAVLEESEFEPKKDTPQVAVPEPSTVQ